MYKVEGAIATVKKSQPRYTTASQIRPPTRLECTKSRQGPVGNSHPRNGGRDRRSSEAGRRLLEHPVSGRSSRGTERPRRPQGRLDGNGRAGEQTVRRTLRTPGRGKDGRNPGLHGHHRDRGRRPTNPRPTDGQRLPRMPARRRTGGGNKASKTAYNEPGADTSRQEHGVARDAHHDIRGLLDNQISDTPVHRLQKPQPSSCGDDPRHDGRTRRQAPATARHEQPEQPAPEETPQPGRNATRPRTTGPTQPAAQCPGPPAPGKKDNTPQD